MREIFRDFGFAQTAPTQIYEDNLACITMSENPVRCKFSRHIDIRRFFVRNMVSAGVLKFVPLRTRLMVADALTNVCSHRSASQDTLRNCAKCRGILAHARLKPSLSWKQMRLLVESCCAQLTI
jgi:sulfur relay (sulfurtransferase) complex TusBCD TusD component (DsrE family)